MYANNMSRTPGDHIQVQEEKMKFRRCLFTFSIKREIRYFHVVVVVLRKRQKSVMHVQSCCLAY